MDDDSIMFLPNQIGTKSAHFFFALISVYVIYCFGPSQFRKMDPKRRRLNAKPPNDIMILPLEQCKALIQIEPNPSLNNGTMSENEYTYTNKL